MPIYERLDSTTLRGSGRGRWRRNAVAGMSAVMAVGAIGSGVAGASTTTSSSHQTSVKAARAESSAPSVADARG